jgi:hypothetical protein
MKIIRWVYPSLVGLLLGLLQTGLFAVADCRVDIEDEALARALGHGELLVLIEESAENGEAYFGGEPAK